MSEPTPEAIERFVARIRQERAASGKPPMITTPAVYNLLDGLLIKRPATGRDTGPKN